MTRMRSETQGNGFTKMPDGWDTGPGSHGSVHRAGREKGKVRGHERIHQGLFKTSGTT